MKFPAATDSDQQTVEISIVIPVYRAEDCLDELHRRLCTVLDKILTPTDWELILVDDLSPDRSWVRMQELAKRDSRVKAYRLSRNFGQEAATSAGYSVATGRWTVTMDCDLQDRPEDIPKLYEAGLAGYDVVRAIRNKTGPLYRRLGTRAYFQVLNRIGGTKIDWREAAFGVIHERVRAAYLQIGDQNRNMLMVLDWMGFPTTHVQVAHDDRFSGDSSYSFMDLVRYAVAGMFFHTTAPLRWIVGIGVSFAGVGALSAVWLVVQRLTNDNVYKGWTSLAVLILLVGGLTIVTIGVSGLYLGKVLDQTRGRPRFIIAEQADSLEDSDIATHTALPNTSDSSVHQ